MVELVEINKIKPAEYNPRLLNEKEKKDLENSIEKLGLILPILVNKKNNIIIAGHQRTKCSKNIGIKKIPVIYINDLVIGDEIKFNQLHNAIDLSENNCCELKKEYQKEKFLLIDNKDFKIINGNPKSTKEICKLILKYGNCLSSVICKNKVIYGNEYVKACSLLNIPVNAYICEDEKFEDVNLFFNKTYGKYFYDNLKKDTYVQGLAQMFRKTEKVKNKEDRQNASKLYETLVLPYLKENEINSILDFGCGKGAYINKLKKDYNAIGVEFYNNNRVGINITKGNNQINELIEFLKDKKTFDIVVCDSVLNSVDSVDAEENVMRILNLFSEKTLFISGRNLDVVKNRTFGNYDGDNKNNYFYYLDDNNFTANYRQGKWYYQKFHNKEQVKKLLKKFGFKIVKQSFIGSSWQVMAEKINNLSDDEYKKGIDFEFNLPLPNNLCYNRHNDIRKVLGYENSEDENKK